MVKGMKRLKNDMPLIYSILDSSKFPLSAQSIIDRLVKIKQLKGKPRQKQTIVRRPNISKLVYLLRLDPHIEMEKTPYVNLYTYKRM